MKLDWARRVNAVDALEHPYFKMSPLPMQPHEIPRYEESHELDRRKFHDRRANLPPAPKGGTVGVGPDANGATAGFNSSDGYASRNGMNGGRMRDDRRPAWQRDRGGPPRGPPPHDDDRERRNRGGPPGPRGADIDTYIPSYGRDDGGRRREERSREDWRPRGGQREDRRHDWDRRTRSRSRSPMPPRDRDMYRR